MSDVSVSLQEVILLPAAAVSELQVSDACPAEWDEGARRTKEGAAQRLLQHTQGDASQQHYLLIYNYKQRSKRTTFTEWISMNYGKLSLSGGHAHPRVVMHEPEAPAALHQERNEEIPERNRAHRGRPWADADGGVREHEPDSVWSERGHTGHARGETHTHMLTHHSIIAASHMTPVASSAGQEHLPPLRQIQLQIQPHRRVHPQRDFHQNWQPHPWEILRTHRQGTADHNAAKCKYHHIYNYWNMKALYAFIKYFCKYYKHLKWSEILINICAYNHCWYWFIITDITSEVNI